MWDPSTLKKLNATADALFDRRWRKSDASPNMKSGRPRKLRKKEVYWTTKAGEKIAISMLPDDHLLNILRLFDKSKDLLRKQALKRSLTKEAALRGLGYGTRPRYAHL